MEPDPEFRKQVKDALEHLYDMAHLETHALLALVASPPASSRLTRAQQLRGLIKEALEQLRPQENAPRAAPEWRSYLALHYRYVRGMSPGEIESELSISLRQLQRELHKGIDALAALLWEKRGSRAAEGETHAWQNELEEWSITRQSVAAAALLDDPLWMLKPLLAERGVTIRAQLPETLPPVFVDATLMRQAIFKTLRALVRSARDETLTLAAAEDAQHIALVVRRAAPTHLSADADWQSAQELCARQGATLVADGAQIVLRLPRASQPRVLVVDDNAGVHQLFERYLAPHGYAMLHAFDGPSALRLAAAEHPDAITLDVMMPNVDGWQVLRALVGDPATASTPIIICSVLKEPDLAFSLGARAYLKKPVDRLELVATLARLVEVRCPASPAPAAPPTTLADNSTPPSPADS